MIVLTESHNHPSASKTRTRKHTSSVARFHRHEAWHLLSQKRLPSLRKSSRQSTSTETRPEEKGFTKERHDVFLTLSLLNSFTLGFDELSSELVDMMTVLP